MLQLTVDIGMPELPHRGGCLCSGAFNTKRHCLSMPGIWYSYSRIAALTLISHLFGLSISKLCPILCQPRFIYVGISGRYLRRGVTEIYAGLQPAGPDALLEGASVALATSLDFAD